MKNQKVTVQYPNGDIEGTRVRNVTGVTRDEYGNETGTAKINGSDYTQEEIKEVRIPGREEHEGYYGYSIVVKVNWVCPVCGGPRGEIFNTFSYDGSRRLPVHGWRNACGHVDKYNAVRIEAGIGNNQTRAIYEENDGSPDEIANGESVWN